MSILTMVILFVTITVSNGIPVDELDQIPRAQKFEILEEKEVEFAEHHNPEDKEHHGEYEHARPSDKVIGWDWHNTALYILVPVVLLAAAVVKIVSDIFRLYKRIPESVMLILLGIVVGGIAHYASHTEASHHEVDVSRMEWSEIQEEQEVPSEAVVFTADRFFFILLPPIILESAYQLHDRAFFNNLGPIFFYAFLGTLMNIIMIGFLLWFMGSYIHAYTYDNNIPPLECILFATIISAVDPVAVLSVFQELKINHPLYFIVFGESLYNDAVVVTIYHVVHAVIVEGLRSPGHLNSGQAIGFGIGKIFLSFFGGILVGFIFGLLSVALTRWSGHARVTEPLVVILIAYLSYMMAEIFWFSGIVSLVTCGLMQQAYVRYNLSEKSNTTIKNVVKILALISEIIIFFFLGRACIIQQHVWDTGFITFAFLFVIVCRFVSVFSLTYLVNKVFKRHNPIQYDEQLIMAVGGLRGAIAFALVYMIDKGIYHKKMFVTTVLFIILFTVIVLGTLTKPLVAVLRVRRQERKDPRSIAFINRKIIETFIPVIEEFAGYHNTNCWMENLEKLNKSCLYKYLVKGGPKAVVDKNDDLGVQKTPNEPHVHNAGPFKEAAQDFKKDDYDDSQIDGPMEQLRKPPLKSMEAGNVARERVQISGNIGQAFADSKVEKKPRNSSLFLGQASKAPIYKNPFSKPKSGSEKTKDGKSGKTSSEISETDLRNAVNKNTFYAPKSKSTPINKN